MTTLTKPIEAPSTEEYVIEQIAPATTADLILVIQQLSTLAAKSHTESLHQPLCRDALLALSDELLRRRLSRG
jgi:hypothetical protein